MLDPTNFYPNPGSYDDVLKRMTQRLQQNGIDDQIVAILQQAVEKEIGQHTIILSRPERNRLFQQVAQALVTNALAKIGGSK